MENLKIELEEKILVKYCVVKHIILLKVLNTIDIKEILFQWFISFLIKRLWEVLLKMFKTKNQLSNYTHQQL